MDRANKQEVEECTWHALYMITYRFVAVFVLLHVMVYAFGFLNYSMKVFHTKNIGIDCRTILLKPEPCLELLIQLLEPLR